MDYLVARDSIIACSSGGNSNSAIAIIRVSGEEILSELNQFFSFDLSKIQPRYATFCKFVFQGKLLDEIIITYFKGPNSYNGEDIIEMSVHGNVLNIERIINIICKNSNIRRANPGEFSYRALRNNKLNLSQVEGLDLLLNANSIFAIDQGFSLLSGKLKHDFKELYDKFLHHRSCLELGFDFLDDVGEEHFNEQFNRSLEDLKKSIDKMYSHVTNQGFNLIKPEIAIVGLPNAGKSSLFNLLLNDDRAIVSNIAGTTRDYISEDIKIGDNIFSIIDTAGIRNSDDIIEEKGIDKALDIVENCFFKLLLVNPFEVNTEYFKKIKSIEFDAVLFSHYDCEGFKGASSKALEILIDIFGPIEPLKSGPIEPTKSGPIEPTKTGPIEPTKTGPIEPSKFGPIEPQKAGPMGAVLNTNNAEVKQYLFDVVSFKYLKLLDFDPILINRHKDSVNSIYLSFSNYYSLGSSMEDLSILGSELNIVGHCVSELIGIISPDEVLHNIFDNFCIGK